MNLPLALVVVGGGVVLAWTGLADPDGGLSAEIGRVLRGEPTTTSQSGGIRGRGATRAAALDTTPTGSSSNAVQPIPTGGATGVRAAIVQEAQRHLGKPYRWGGKGPDTFDCSGFVEYVFRVAAQRSIPAPSEAQCFRGVGVSEAAAQPGDLVCYGTPAHHIGIYLGGGRYIHAPKTGDVVKVSDVNWSSHYYRNVLSDSERYV